MSYDKYNINWAHVEKALGERGESGYKIAVIETRKIFFQVLKDKLITVPKESAIPKLPIFKNADALKHALIMTRKIYEDLGFELSRQEVKEIIAVYYDAVKKLAALPSVRPTGPAKIAFFILRILPAREFAGIIVGIFVLAGFIVFLDRSELGGKITAVSVAISEFFVFKVLFVVIVIALIAGIWKIRQGKS